MLGLDQAQLAIIPPAFGMGLAVGLFIATRREILNRQRSRSGFDLDIRTPSTVELAARGGLHVLLAAALSGLVYFSISWLTGFPRLHEDNKILWAGASFAGAGLGKYLRYMYFRDRRSLGVPTSTPYNRSHRNLALLFRAHGAFQNKVQQERFLGC